MKRIAYVLAVCLLLFSFAGCKQNNSDIQKPAEFYYCRIEAEFHHENGVISSEIRDISGLSDDLTELMNYYLKGPQSDSLASPFLNGSSIENATVANGKATINLGRQFSLLKDYDLSLACICIAKTIFSVTDAETVILKANSAFHDGSLYKAFSKTSFMDSDNANQFG